MWPTSKRILTLSLLGLLSLFRLTSEDLEPGFNDVHVGQDQRWGNKEKRIYNSLASGLNSNIDFSLGKSKLSGKLGQTFLRLNLFHQGEVQSSLKHLENDFFPYVEAQIKKDPNLLLRPETKDLVHELRSASQSILDLKKSLESWNQKLERILRRFDDQLEVLAITSPDSLKSLAESMALAGATEKEQKDLLEILQEVSEVYLNLSFQVSSSSENFELFYKKVVSLNSPSIRKAGAKLGALATPAVEWASSGKGFGWGSLWEISGSRIASPQKREKAVEFSYVL